MGKGSKRVRAKRRKQMREEPFEEHGDLEGILNDGKNMSELMNGGTPPGIDPILWSIHFPDLSKGKKPTCEDCIDYKAGVCEGGRNPVECFGEQFTTD
jgi:hypothetical protein